MSTTAVPSKLPEDFALNIDNLDKFSNSTSPTFTDRLGVVKKTITGVLAEYPNASGNAADAAVSAGDAQTQANIAMAQAGISTAQAGLAATAKTDAETARDAANVNGKIYATTAAGLAAVASGGYFSVPSPDSAEYLILYLNNAGAAVEQKRYPSAAAVQKPNWAGKRNGWPDPFFRTFDLTSHSFLGRDRWWQNTAASGVPVGWTRVANAIFDGYALRRTAGYNTTTYSGPLIWLDELGAAVGDTITAYILVSGSAGGAVSSACRFKSSTESDVGSASPMLSATGASSITASATPQYLRVSMIVPSTSERLAIYPYNAAGSTGFDVLACWVFKGAVSDGPEWPALQDSAFEIRDADFGNRIAAVEPITTALGVDVANKKILGAYIPFVRNESVLGDAEMAGDADYAIGILGYYDQAAQAALFNAVQCRIWASNAATSVEWKVWVRSTKTPFNMSSTPAQASGTVAAGAFPTTNTLYTLQLPSLVPIAANEYLFVMFKCVDGTNMNMRRWLYNAAITPARRNLPLAVSTTWNVTWAEGGAAGGYGQPAIKLVFQSEELRAFVAPSQTAAATPYSNTASGLPASNVQAAIDLLAVAQGAPELVMPPYIFGAQGRECSVYLDNLFLADAADYLHDFAASYGQQQAERWTWVPSAALAAGTLVYSAHDKRTGTLLASKTAQLRAAAATAGTGTTKKVLVIGDSLISAGTITQTLIDIAATDAMGLISLGTQGAAPNNHEGRGGWTVANYTSAGPTYYQFTVSGVTVAPLLNATEYTNNGSTYRVQEVSLSGGAGTLRCSVVSGGAPLASGTLTKSNAVTGDATIAYSVGAAVAGNPFWIGGAVNFPQYLTDRSIAMPDWVLIGLGINDVFGQTTDAAAASTADAALVLMDTLIASIKAAGAGVKVGLMLPTPPAASQDAFGANYAAGQTRWRYKRNILIWARQLIVKYAGQEANRIYLVPSNTALDTANNYPRGVAAPVNSRNTAVTVARQVNGVHPGIPPDITGYQQIGDAVWAFLKFYA